MEPTSDSLDLWCDAEFSGNRGADTAHIDRNTGYVVKYAGCPITWVSKICIQKRA